MIVLLVAKRMCDTRENDQAKRWNHDFTLNSKRAHGTLYYSSLSSTLGVFHEGCCRDDDSSPWRADAR